MRNLEIQTNETADVRARNEMTRAQNSETAQKDLSRKFYLLAVFEFLTILCGAITALLVAPASLFVSRAEPEAFAWIAAGIVAACFAVVGLLALPLALLAARGANRGKSYGKVCGSIAGVLAILQFPLGTIFGALILRKIFKSDSFDE